MFIIHFFHIDYIEKTRWVPVKTSESAVAELEHFIGYGGKQLGTVRYHPVEAESTS